MFFDRFPRIVAHACLFAILLAPLGAASIVAAEDDPVVAVVNGAEIRRSEVLEIQQALPEQYQSVPFDVVFPALVERLIDLQLVAGEGRKAGLEDDPFVRRRMAQIETRVIREAYLTRYIEQNVSEEMVRAHYDAFIAETPPQEEIRARHILLDSEEAAKAVILRLSDGADFAELAKESSIGPSAPRGGDLGYFTRSTMVPEFAEAAFALAVGEVSPAPVKTQFGWHVIKIEDRRTAAPPTFEEVGEKMNNEVTEQVVRKLMDKLREVATIERFNADGTPKTEE
ncbi:MAG: peptidylprolyl isomerase [Alphaproteobacteria bacterium]